MFSRLDLHATAGGARQVATAMVATAHIFRSFLLCEKIHGCHGAANP